MGPKNVLVWKVRGLHAGTQRHALRDLVAAEWISLVCIEETKLDVISDYDVIQLLGTSSENVYLLVVHTRGGILVAYALLFGSRPNHLLDLSHCLSGCATQMMDLSGGSHLSTARCSTLTRMPS
jgi:hypothetical protein